jgi:dihydrofolate synthase/folylpolyglutamate synthase
VALGVMKDKDVEGMVRALLPVASRFVVTSVAGERALAGEALAFRIRRIDGTRRGDIARDGEAAVATALQDAPAAVVAGSIFLIGPLRARLIAAGAVSLRH